MSTLPLKQHGAHKVDDSRAELRRLYPTLSEEQLERLRNDLRDYLIIALRIFDRIQAEERERFLTGKTETPTIQTQRSNPLSIN